jgi:hypothetical protein
MEHFEQNITNYSSTKAVPVRYMDDIFVVWTHGEEDLQRLVLFLNSIQQSLKFAVHKREQTMPSLNVLLSNKLDRLLGHVVYRQPITMDLYLHGTSEHSSQKRDVLSILICQAKTICDLKSLNVEIQHLSKMFQQNG